MKITLTTRGTDSGKLRLIFSYSCQSRRFFPTGITIPSEDLHKDRIERPVRKSNPNADHYNAQISLLYHEIHKIISTLRRDDKVPLADLVYKLHQEKKRIELLPVLSETFTDIYTNFVNEKGLTKATRKLYDNMHDQVLECCPDLNLEEFDAKHWTDFRDFLKYKKKHSINTVCIRLTKLKAMLRFLKEGGMSIPIQKFPLPQEEIKKIFLDLKDLNKVIQYSPEDKTMEEIKDLFIFQCHTALRISELFRVNKMHVREVMGNHFITMGAYKSNKPMMIPLDKLVLDIWIKYQFKLPQITEQHYNRMIKKLIRLAGITTKFEWLTHDLQGKKIVKSKFLYEIFTNHCCSRTAIKYFFSKGYTPDQVARIVGKSLDTIMGYYYEEASEDDIIMRTMQFAAIGTKAGPST